jgi:hypothetical protein
VFDNAPEVEAEEARVRLRAALRRIVEGVWCLFVGRGRQRLAAVQIWFTGGARRDYLILHRPAQGGALAPRPADWWVRSLASVPQAGDLDLRKRGDARELERVLEAVDLDEDEHVDGDN